MAQSRAQDIAEVLDPEYIPTTSKDIGLFMGKQKFIYAVFEKTLLTDKGKALVCQHQLTFDAQLIYKELLAYAMLSTKTALNAADLLSYITNTTLADGKWKGPTHSFVLYWQDQVRKYSNLSAQTALSPTLLLSLLQDAVNPISELCQVKMQAAQMETFLGKDLSYDYYCGLLLSTAQQYDQQHAKKGNTTVKRRIYQHDFYTNYEPDNFHDAKSYNIDHPLSMIQ